jgi:predicted transcriptional regulator
VLAKAVGDVRKLFIAGVLSEQDYWARLVEAGYTFEAADVMTEQDLTLRDRQAVADFQRYELPALRDKLQHAEITEDGYRSALAAGGFPEQYVSAELDLARRRAADWRQGRVSRYELGPYESAYVVGLASAAFMSAQFGRAGLTAQEISAQMSVLERSRRAYNAQRAAVVAANDERLQKAAQRQAEALAARLERERAAARGVTEEWAKLKAADAKAQLRPLADQLIAEVRKGEAANADTLARLTDQLTDALWWAAVSTS